MTTALLEQAMGRRLWNAGELLTYVEMNEQEVAGMGAVLGLLGRMCIDTLTGEPATGFVGDEFLCAKGGSDREFTIEPGLGFQYVSGSSGVWEHGYQPVLLTAQHTAEVDPHDLTLPRIDLILVKSAESDDSAENRSVKDLISGSVSSQSINTRRVYTAAIEIAKGTPAASPARPSAAAGYIVIAEVYIPPTSGAITVTDERPRLALGQSWTPDPPKGFASPHVVEGHGGSLEVSAGSGMEVVVAAGEMWFEGYRHRHTELPLSVAAPDATHDRYDIVACHRTTGARIITGTAGANPVPPMVSLDAANEIVLALLEVPVGASSLTGKIIDERDVEPHRGDTMLQKRSTPISHLASPPLRVDIGSSSFATDTFSVSLQMKDADGQTMQMPTERSQDDFPTQLLATVFDEGWERVPSTGSTGMQLGVTTGTSKSTTSRSGLLFDTDDDGSAVITITRADPGFTGDVWLRFEPVTGGTTNETGFPAAKKLTFS